jgi:hypothetical protein
MGKNGLLDIPEVGSDDQTNTDSWIYQRWDQMLNKHGLLDIPEVGSDVKQTRTPGYTRGGIRR